MQTALRRKNEGGMHLRARGGQITQNLEHFARCGMRPATLDIGHRARLQRNGL